MEVQPRSKSMFEFLLSRRQHAYFFGETIQGTVKLTIINSKIVKKIDVVLNGEVFVDLYPLQDCDVQYATRDKLKIAKTNISGQRSLPIGEHSFNFSISLMNPNFPTSFIGHYGSVLYNLSLILYREEKYDNIYSAAVTLIQPYDLNLFPLYRNPQESKEPSACNCWGILRRQMNCTMRTPFRAYTAGQTLKYTLELQNVPRSGIQRFYVHFIRKMKFYVGNESLSTVALVVNQNLLREPLTDNLVEQSFLIPPTTPSTSGPARIVIKYILQARVVLSGCTCQCIEAELPIVIGTVPLKESLAIGKILSPPGFEVDIEHKHDAGDDLTMRTISRLDYRPRYPIYKFTD